MNQEVKKAEELNKKIDKLLKQAEPREAFKVYLRNLLIAEYEQKFKIQSSKFKNTNQRFKMFFPKLALVGSFLGLTLLLGIVIKTTKKNNLTQVSVEEVESQLTSFSQDLEELDVLVKEAEEIDFTL